MGAAAIATIIATPLPKYAEGGDILKPTIAITDEKGAEGYVTKSGFYVGSNKPNVKYLEPGTRIIPHHELNNFMLNAMISTAPQDQLSKKIDQMMIANYSQNKELIRTIKKNKPIVRNNIHIDGSNWVRDNISQ
jgi:hypothetical protein